MKKKICLSWDGTFSWPIKLFKVMKLTVLLLLVSMTGVLANKSYSQSKMLNLNMREASVKEVLSNIEEQSEFFFLYSENLIDVERKVDLAIENQKIEHVLNLLFDETGVNYSIRDRIIVLTTPEMLENEIKALQKQNSISGKVTDSSGLPLPGVTILIKGTTNGTVTDIDGVYTIKNVPDDAALIFSFVGMNTQEIEVAGKSSVDVMMTQDAIGIDEVVAIGYGIAKKSDLTGAVSSIGSEAITRQPATNVAELLSSAMPGLNISTSISVSGSSNMEIRGTTSLATNQEPLLVVDDVIYTGSIANINPVDIKSVDVLKDASASAIYGAKAAAGVVIITTKKGTETKPTINFHSTFGVATPNKMEEVYGVEGYLKYRGDVLVSQGQNSNEAYFTNPSELPSNVSLSDWLGYDNLDETTITSPQDIWLGRLQLQDIEIENYKAGNSLDWKDIVFQTGLRTDNTLSLSGRTKNLSYYTSIGYTSNEGIEIYQKYEAFRARINIEADVNKFLSVGWNVQGTEVHQPVGIPGGREAYDKSSPLGTLYNDDGSIRIYPHDDSMAGNPYLFEYEDNYYRQRELFANLYTKLTLPFGFSFRTNWSNRYVMSQQYMFTSSRASLSDGGDVGSRAEATRYNWMIDNILKWNKDFGEHSFDVTLLYNAEENNYWYSYQRNSDFSPNETLTYHNLEGGTNPEISQEDTKSTADAFMARLNYGLLDKYLLTLSIRRDGYSAFGQSNPYAYFPSVALGWRISEEEFMDVDWLSNLKLRLSWGKNGNRSIGAYSALAEMETIKYIYDESDVTGITTSSLSNTNLKWETTETDNIGVDFGLFKGRISGSIDAYYMSTTDLLMRRSLPNITGYGSVYANLGEVTNKGVEVALNTVNIEKNNITWKSAFSFSMNRNEIKHLYGDMVDVLDEDGNVIGQREDDDVSNGWYIGHAIDEIYHYKVLGIYQLDEAEEAAEYGKVPGDVKLWDKNDDGVVSTDDRVFQGYRKPRYRLSLRNDFTVFQNFNISFLINSNLAYYGSNSTHFNTRTSQERLNKIVTPYWTEDNPTNEWTKLSSDNSSPSAVWWESKSFVRLQNFNVAYNVPKRILQRAQIEGLRLSANIRNLPAISGWKYNWDVETSDVTPMIITFGVDLTL